MAIGLLLTEVGLAIKEIAADETSTQVIGAVITADAVVVGAAVVTADGAAYKVVAATAEGRGGGSRRSHDEGAVVVDVVAVPDAPAADAAPAAPAADAPKS